MVRKQTGEKKRKKKKNHLNNCDDELMLNVLRCQLTYLGQVVTNAEAQFSNSLRQRKPLRRLVRTDSPGRPPRLSHSSGTMSK